MRRIHRDVYRLLVPEFNLWAALKGAATKVLEQGRVRLNTEVISPALDERLIEAGALLVVPHLANERESLFFVLSH